MSGTSKSSTGSTDGKQRGAPLEKQNERVVDPSPPLPADLRREQIRAAAGGYRAAGVNCQNRPLAGVEKFAEGLELVSPGVVTVPRWRPTPGEPVHDDGDVSCYGFVARKP